MKNLSLKFLLLKIKFSYEFKPRSYDTYINSLSTLFFVFLIGIFLAIPISVAYFPLEYIAYLGDVFTRALVIFSLCASVYIFVWLASSDKNSFLSLIHFLTQPFFAFKAKHIEKHFEKLHFIFTKEGQEDILEDIYSLSQKLYFEHPHELTKFSNFYKILYNNIYPKHTSRKTVQSYAELKSSFLQIEQEQQDTTFFEKNEKQNSKQTAFHK